MKCSVCGESSEAEEGFCESCGAALSTVVRAKKKSASSQVARKSKASATRHRAATDCPACGSSSNVQIVGSIVSGGTTSSRGSALSVPLTGGGWVQTYYGSTSSTYLAQRVAPGNPPSARAWPWVLLGTFIGGLLICGGVSDFLDSWGLRYFVVGQAMFWLSWGVASLIMLIPSFFLAWMMTAIGNRTWMIPRRADYQQVANRIWNARYCHKDDVMFDETFAGSPEQFKANAW